MINDSGKNNDSLEDPRYKLWIQDHALIVTLSIFLILKSVVIILFMSIFYYIGDSVGEGYTNFHSGIDIIDLLGTRWDSNIYIPIAQNGYGPINSPDDHRAWAFPPLYPLFIRLFVLIFPLDLHYTVAAVIVSNFFSVLSIIAFFRMSRTYLNEISSITATLLFGFFPPIFVFSTVAYSEAIFLTFAITSWHYFEEKKFLRSGFLIAVATLARSEGFLLFLLYFTIFISRSIKQKGIKETLGCIIALPLFPLVLAGKAIESLWSILNLNQKVSLIIKRDENRLKDEDSRLSGLGKAFHQILEYLDIKISLVLIWGIIPLVWMNYVNTVAPIPVDQIRMKFWGARFVFPFESILDMISSGNIIWFIEKYSFVFLIFLIGILNVKKRPSLSLLILGYTIFYASYTAQGWSIVRYVGSIFPIHIILAEELSSTRKFFILLLLFFILYSFKVLWSFTHWSIWLI